MLARAYRGCPITVARRRSRDRSPCAGTAAAGIGCAHSSASIVEAHAVVAHLLLVRDQPHLDRVLAAGAARSPRSPGAAGASSCAHVDAGRGAAGEVGHAVVQHRARDLGLFAQVLERRQVRAVEQPARGRAARTPAAGPATSTRLSRDSWRSCGSSSVSRSSSDGCRRSFCVSSAMRVNLAAGAGAPRSARELDLADVHQRVLAARRSRAGAGRARRGRRRVLTRSTRCCAPCTSADPAPGSEPG